MYNVYMLGEDSSKGFTCINCHKWVPINIHIGTGNRNHCPHCLWSRHVDRSIPGDREAGCDVGMRPIALTLKKTGLDKYGNKKLGEVMIVHICIRCNKISINRIASDDNVEEIINVFNSSLILDDKIKTRLKNMYIDIITEKDREDLENQLFGKQE